MTSCNIKIDFRTTGIRTTNSIELQNQMNPSESFIQKPLEIHIQEILEEKYLAFKHIPFFTMLI